MRFEPGQVILHRNTRRGRVSLARPVRVVSDTELGLLVWLARDTPVMAEVGPDGRGVRGRPFTEWITLSYHYAAGSWQGPGILMFFPPEADHSVWWFWTESGEFHGWYVNLEERAIRSDAGIEVVDQDLDVWVHPDRTWEWKDEDEFTERLAHPDHYWVSDEQAVRDEGLRVIKKVEAGEFPFDGTWTSFVPDPAWELPDLPADWNHAVQR